MQRFIITAAFLFTPLLAQCDWNDDGSVDILDVVATVNCILVDCYSEEIYGCTDPEALNFNPEATVDDDSCEYDDVCVDFDGNIYETVQIGNQVWMAENLKVTHYNNGDEIPNITGNGEWGTLLSGAYCNYYNNQNNVVTYGRLYNWYAIDDDRGVCPEGFHIPADGEWTELTEFLGDAAGSQLAGYADLWSDGGLENDPAFGSSGFSGLPGGYRFGYNGYYYSLGEVGCFWTSTADNDNSAWNWLLHYVTSSINRYSSSKQIGFSIRCIHD